MHSDETAQAGLALYKLYLTSYEDLDPVQLMIKKHDLFLAILQANVTSEKKVACALDQAILAASLLHTGQWKKGSIVKSLASTVLWTLTAIDAHWCRLSTTGDEVYTPFSPDFVTLDMPDVEPPNFSPVSPDTSSNEIDLEDDSGDETDEMGHGDDVEADSLLRGLELSQIDAAEVQSLLKRISPALDRADDFILNVKKEGSIDPLVVKQ